MRYDWPGNIRELENVVERCVIMARGDYLTPEELPSAFKHLTPDDFESNQRLHQSKSLKEMEKIMIMRTLEETSGNRTRAAKILGISRRTLQHKLKDYGIN